MTESTGTGGRFRKKPVVVHAEPYRPGIEDGFAIPPSGHRGYPPPPGDRQARNTAYAAYIDTLEGRHWIARGDWIITGVRGERYPIKGDIFAETYERITDDE